MKEARDDVGRIYSILDEMAIENRYIHSDAALCGGYAAYLDPPAILGFRRRGGQYRDFGPQVFGIPDPCGVVLARRAHVERIGHSVAYIGSMDTTISGSRNGLTPLVLWYAIRALGTKA